MHRLSTIALACCALALPGTVAAAAPCPSVDAVAPGKHVAARQRAHLASAGINRTASKLPRAARTTARPMAHIAAHRMAALTIRARSMPAHDLPGHHSLGHDLLGLDLKVHDLPGHDLMAHDLMDHNLLARNLLAATLPARPDVRHPAGGNPSAGDHSANGTPVALPAPDGLAARHTTPGNAVPGQAAAWQSAWRAADAKELDATRGGFELPSGLAIGLGIERTIAINGELVTHTRFAIEDVRLLTVDQAALARDAMSSLQIVQRGAAASGSAALGAGPTPGATLVQNSLDNQRIQSQTVIDASVNTLNSFKALNFSSSVTDALTRAVAGH